MIRFNCEHCGRGIRVRDEAAGRRGKCHECGQTVTIPVEPQSVEPQRPPKRLEAVKEVVVAGDVAVETVVPVAAEVPAATPQPTFVEVPAHKTRRGAYEVVFAIGKTLAMFAAFVVLIFGFMAASSAIQETTVITLACFFLIVARIFQAEEHSRGIVRRMR